MYLESYLFRSFNFFIYLIELSIYLVFIYLLFGLCICYFLLVYVLTNFHFVHLCSIYFFSTSHLQRMMNTYYSKRINMQARYFSPNSNRPHSPTPIRCRSTNGIHLRLPTDSTMKHLFPFAWRCEVAAAGQRAKKPLSLENQKHMPYRSTENPAGGQSVRSCSSSPLLSSRAW